MMELVQVDSSTVILVRYMQNSSATQDLWIKPVRTINSSKKRDSIEEKSHPESKTISVTNIPPYCTQESLKAIFSRCGTVEKITFNSKDKLKVCQQGTRQAFIVFSQKGSVDAALSLKYDGGYTLSKKTHLIPHMHTAYRQEIYREYSINPQTLMSECTKYMEKYDEKAKNRKDAAKLAGVPDADGWTTVTSTRYKKAGKQLKGHELEKFKKKKKNTELLHFYKQQVGDAKMEKIRELKRKFEADKKKILEMRQNRKFKPY